MEVHDKCLPVLQQFGYAWPANLACDLFPEANKKDEMCMPGPIAPARGPISEKTKQPPTPHWRASTVLPSVSIPPAIRGDYQLSVSSCLPENGFVFVNLTKRCAMACEANVITSQDEKNAADIFHGVVASVCILLGVTVFSLNGCRPVRLSTQEKPTLYILLCLVMVSIGYIARLAGGRTLMGCTGDDGDSYVILEGVLEVKGCIAVFILLYYFGLAANLWWLMMVVLWFYSAIKEMKPKKLEGILKRAHFVAWFIPVVPTVIALAMRLIDAGKLTFQRAIAYESL